MFRKSLSDIASTVSLENDTTVSFLLFDKTSFERYRNALPVLKNVEKEGITIG